jgi:hypothetical protein
MIGGIEALNFIGEETYPWCEESKMSVPGWGRGLKK